MNIGSLLLAANATIFPGDADTTKNGSQTTEVQIVPKRSYDPKQNWVMGSEVGIGSSSDGALSFAVYGTSISHDSLTSNLSYDLGAELTLGTPKESSGGPNSIGISALYRKHIGERLILGASVGMEFNNSGERFETNSSISPRISYKVTKSQKPWSIGVKDRITKGRHNFFFTLGRVF